MKCEECDGTGLDREYCIHDMEEAAGGRRCRHCHSRDPEPTWVALELPRHNIQPLACLECDGRGQVDEP